MQHCQLPWDLYSTLVYLVPAGEEEPFLFLYWYIARLPPGLRMYSKGLLSFPIKLLADIYDYLWGFWSDTGGAAAAAPHLDGTAVHHPGAPHPGGAAAAAPNTGGATVRHHSTPFLLNYRSSKMHFCTLQDVAYNLE